jgi:tetratricopeptide (TPR) repeat protein
MEDDLYLDDATIAHHQVVARRKRRRQRLTIGGAVAILLLCLWLGVRPTGRAIKTWQAKRLARSASQLINQGRLDEASRKAIDALQLRHGEPEAWRSIAQLFTRAGRSTEAMEWWRKLNDRGKLTIEDRRDFAGAALAAGEVTIAGQQIDSLLAQKDRTLPGDYLLAAQYTATRGDSASSRDYAQIVLAHPTAQPKETLSAALIILAVSDRTSPEYADAWDHLVRLGRGNPTNESLRALEILAGQPAPMFNPRPGVGSPLSISLPNSQTRERTILYNEIATRIKGHPAARVADQLIALGLRSKENPGHTDQYVGEAIKRYAGGTDEEVGALANWLQQQHRPEDVLRLVPADRALKRREFLLARIDALTALERWHEAKQLLTSDQFPLEETLKYMYLAVISSKLGEHIAEKNEWQRALDISDTADKALALAAYAERNGAFDVADSAYGKAIFRNPDLRQAYDNRLALARLAGQTAKAQEISADIVKRWPNDRLAQNANAYLRLLRGASPAEAEGIERDAQALVIRNPNSWEARSTLGLARLRLGRPAAALEAFANGAPERSDAISAQVVYVAAKAANGWIQEAKDDVQGVTTFDLLPEERALVAPLLATAP